MQSDPIGLSGGINPYGYVEANPLGFVDLLGLDASTTINGKSIGVHVDIAIYGKGLDRIGQSGMIRGEILAKELNRTTLQFWNSQNWKYGECSVYIHINILYGQNPAIPNNIEIVDYGSPVRSGVFGRIENNKTLANRGIVDIRHLNAFNHEIGHLMTLNDKYTGVDPHDYYDNNVRLKDWENNIMANTNGIVEQRNITTIVENLIAKNSLEICKCKK